ncbi:DNA gyrase subunit A [Gimesia sp.]|uniref:DNA gyrase subunit A n=1 Tax=Gimesia sp. TaxID=2024833 RepID=UPI000C3BC572|nr:DNA gyrase subunit A [Gimesia sp.]MAX40585.1 DNA gyrase subunit A [Gimesia sp.]HBL42056.1 DNA gyrase subunit A [Planctomycetaceae bacterium]
MSSDNGEDPIIDKNIKYLDIQDEMRDSYLTYAMSVIISRALPDARDGLKPSQRRILVAMNDLNLGASSSRVKCAKISGDTSGNYHPHGDGSIYPTLVRLGQDWVMRNVLIDKQGNFGSLAGLPPAAMRYTEARLSAVAAEMLDDINRNTVDFVPTYDQRNDEPVVLPSKFPNLLVNGSSGIAVGMATSIPPQNLGEACEAITLLIDNPEATIDDILQVMPGPDFPTGGIICGRYGIRKGYATGRSTITLRARTHFETEKQSDVIVVTEIPYMETRDRIREKLETLVRDDRVKGISRIVDLTDRNVPPWKVHLQIILKRDADKEVVLAQLFKFSPLQNTFSIILLALVGNRPETLSIKELIQQFILHRIDVIRRRTEFMLAEARKRKHTVEGLMIAQIDIDEVIKTIRNSPSRAEAKISLQGLQVDGKLIERALGEDGFKEYQNEQGVHEFYSLSANQAEAIVSMQLGSLANLEREKLSGEHQELLKAISEYLHLLSDEDHIRAVIREDMLLLQQKYSDKRRTDISEDELTDVNRDDLITEEPMVVTLSQRGYIKRTQLNTYQAQNRGGKGVKGVKTDEEDPIQHLFVSSTHSFLLFITNRGRVYWSKVYDLPLQGRTAKGRALVNLLSLQEDEAVSNCVAVREFDEERFLVMATRNGIIKKSPLSAYSRPQKGGIIAIKLDEEDELVEALIVSPGEDLLLATSDGMAIRFAQSDARSMGRNTRGVKGIKLSKSGHVIGMVIANPETCLLTVCENGYGKRTPFGFIPAAEENGDEEVSENDVELTAEPESDSDENTDEEQETRSGMHYRRQRRGGKGIRDIRTSARNGNAVDIIPVAENDEVLMVTRSGKIQRVRGCEISQVGRNTQGVRVITLDANDKLVSLARIPAEIVDEAENEEVISTPENNIQSPTDTNSSIDEIG